MFRTANLAKLCRERCSRFQVYITHDESIPGYISTTSAKQLRTSTSMIKAQTSFENTRKSGDRWNPLLAPGACMFLTAVVLASCSPAPVEASWWSFSGRGTRDRGAGSSPSPFDDVVPRRTKKQRARAESEMRDYLEKMRVPVQELITALREGNVTRDDFERKMASFNDQVERETRKITFGDQADARRQYEAEHGNCRYTPEAIEAIASLSPLIEFRADRGHWQRALTAAGATVVSYVPWSPPPHRSALPPEMASAGKVFPGDETAIRMHQDKTLLVVYPPPGDMALRCLQEYHGDALVYVGEGRGGVNSCDDFFDRLDAEWEVVTVLDLNPFPLCFERLFVLRRNTLPVRKEAVRAPGGANNTEVATGA